MLREKMAIAYVCDCCGAEIDDKTSLSVTMHLGGEVWFEWWVCGDYCAQCARRLAEAIVDEMPMPERYDNGFQDTEGRIRREVEMIREAANDYQ